MLSFDPTMDQSILSSSNKQLDIRGVIYSIVHIPTSKVYVGQTILTAHQRLKVHWQCKGRGDFRNTGLHALMRKSHSIKEYCVFPLEYINPYWYNVEGKLKTKLFRSFANSRETFWIKYLKSLKNQRGLNIFLPYKTNNRQKP